jgi:drug/metabolite transporter (DMT)-like permease
VLLGVVFLHEKLDAKLLAGCVLIVSGALLTLK